MLQEIEVCGISNKSENWKLIIDEEGDYDFKRIDVMKMDQILES